MTLNQKYINCFVFFFFFLKWNGMFSKYSFGVSFVPPLNGWNEMFGQMHFIRDEAWWGWGLLRSVKLCTDLLFREIHIQNGMVTMFCDYYLPFKYRSEVVTSNNESSLKLEFYLYINGGIELPTFITWDLLKMARMMNPWEIRMNSIHCCRLSHVSRDELFLMPHFPNQLF